MSVSEIADLMRDYVVRPCLRELATEAGIVIDATIRVKIGNEIITLNDLMGSEQSPLIKRGEFRIVTPAVEGVGTISFSGECILDDFAEGTGFSGPSVRGKIKLLGSAPDVRMFARTNRYNVWDWGGPFRFEGLIP